MNQSVQDPKRSFEALKKTNAYGAEYWSARDLQPLLGYKRWTNFERAIRKAIASCSLSGNRPEYHFAAANPISPPSGRARADYFLSRFACYLIAQNGDSRNTEIAQAQKYFAIQARRQEINDARASDLDRFEMRRYASAAFKALSGAARQAGVQDSMFGAFHDAGYKGLYGGLSNEMIKAKKGIPPKEQLMDRMGTTELAANQFRMTQTRDKLTREQIHDQAEAIEAHEQVAQEVRQAIVRIGGTLPEELKPAEHIRHVVKRLQTKRTQLQLDNDQARGLAGSAETQSGG